MREEEIVINPNNGILYWSEPDEITIVFINMDEFQTHNIKWKSKSPNSTYSMIPFVWNEKQAKLNLHC